LRIPPYCLNRFLDSSGDIRCPLISPHDLFRHLRTSTPKLPLYRRFAFFPDSLSLSSAIPGPFFIPPFFLPRRPLGHSSISLRKHVDVRALRLRLDRSPFRRSSLFSALRISTTSSSRFPPRGRLTSGHESFCPLFKLLSYTSGDILSFFISFSFFSRQIFLSPLSFPHDDPRSALHSFPPTFFSFFF